MRKENNVMEKMPLRVTGMALVLLLLIAFTVDADSGAPGRLAKITLLNGTTRTVQLDGVGCSESICSRVAIRGRSERGSLVEMRLDTVAAIRRTAAGQTLFGFKDGKEQLLSLVPGFRVLYVVNR